MADPTATVTLDWPAGATLAVDTSLPPLPPLPLATEGIEVQGLLGEGASATVHRAQHGLLERQVAIKRLKHGSTDRALARLLREGRTMGSLEHPNIVPVHAIGVDGSGRPALVMKHVDGRVWEPGELERDLAVLVECCAALAFAHLRGVVHRDLKPDNVLIGPHDEVYLGDWGIAVSVGESVPPGGTPWYMAPEMFASGAAAPSMDVYQVGACLHRVLTGEPRNPGATLQDCAESAGNGCTPSVEPELAELANACCARDPSARPPLEQVQRQLSDWLTYRPTRQLARVAQQRLEQLRGEPVPDPTTLTECLFAWRQVVEQRPNTYEAGLIEALRLALEDACRRDVNTELAPAWLEELERFDGPSPESREALAASVERVRQRAAQAWDADFQVDYQARFRSYAGWLGAFGVLTAIGVVVGGLDHETHRGSLAVAGLFTLTLAATAWLRWPVLSRNRANRVLLAALFLMGGLLLVSRATALVLGVPVAWMHAADAGLLGAVTLTLGLTYGAVTRWIGATMLLGVPVILLVPEGSSALAFVASVAAAPIGFSVAGLGRRRARRG